MSSIALLMNLMGGLGVFLYGLKLLSDFLQKVSSAKLRTFFDKLTKNRFAGLTFGAVVTSLLQSSSATTVLMIGFVNAGLISLVQAISIIFGANIGTTITAQIIAFKATAISLPLIAVGVFLIYFVKKERWHNIGYIFLGLGLIFFGLHTMSSILKPLRGNPFFTDIFVKFGQNPFLGVMAGAVVTMILQSSSATTGMIITLAVLGMLDFNAAFCLALGTNIGTTITAQLASIGANISAKRAAWAHTLFNVFGSLYMLALIFVTYKGTPVFLKFIDVITPGDVFQGENIGRHIANAHTFFNVFNALILFPFIPQLAKLTEYIVPGKVEVRVAKKYLDNRMLNTPSIALQQSIKEIVLMLGTAKDMTINTYKAIYKRKDKNKKAGYEQEDILNEQQDNILHFIINLESESLTPEEVVLSNELIQFTHRIERIGDHNKNILDLDKDLHKIKPKASEKTRKDELEKIFGYIKTKHQQIQDSFQIVLAFLDKKYKATEDFIEEKFDALLFEKEFRKATTHSLKAKHISPKESIAFMEIFHQMEQVQSHLVKMLAQIKEFSKA